VDRIRIVPDLRRPIVIAGAGPHGLSAALHLIDRDPSTRQPLVVCDPSGDWLTTWRGQFDAMHIDRLRSPVVHHSGCDPMSLSEFCHAHGRHAELFPRYSSPSANLFDDFTADLIVSHHIDDLIRPTSLTEICVDGDLIARCANGDEIRAEAVIVATNPHRIIRPEWAIAAPDAPIVHTSELSDAAFVASTPDAELLVVGGGLSAGQVALHGCAQFSHVTMVARRPMRCSEFDTDPGWLGPKHLNGFEAEPDPAQRWEQVLAARDGGSIPEWMNDELMSLVAQSRLTIIEGDQVASVDHDRAHWRARTVVGRSINTSLIVLATGTAPDVTVDAALRHLVTPANTLSCGLPMLSPDLSWVHPRLFVMGRLAALQLGPTAGNLSGARFGARRITDALYAPAAEPATHRTRRPRSFGRRKTPVEHP